MQGKLEDIKIEMLEHFHGALYIPPEAGRLPK